MNELERLKDITGLHSPFCLYFLVSYRGAMPQLDYTLSLLCSFKCILGLIDFSTKKKGLIDLHLWFFQLPLFGARDPLPRTRFSTSVYYGVTRKM